MFGVRVRSPVPVVRGDGKGLNYYWLTMPARGETERGSVCFSSYVASHAVLRLDQYNFTPFCIAC